MGVKVLEQFALLGQWDFLNIIEAPDVTAMARRRHVTGGPRHAQDDDPAHHRHRRAGCRARGRVAPIGYTHQVWRLRSRRTSSQSMSTGSTVPSEMRRSR